MKELILLNIFLSVAFVLAPLMTNRFFLNHSRLYSDAHKIAVIVLVFGAFLNLAFLTGIWPFFCAFGFVLYLAAEYRNGLTTESVASSIPFLFSLISSAWFLAGTNDLHLLGYSKIWSFYAALHGSFLGWIFVGCLAALSKRPHSNRFFSWGCYLSLVFFLFVAFGIDGVPYIKSIGVIGFALVVPASIGFYALTLNRKHRVSRYLALLSLVSIIVSMTLAVLNEFWVAAPRVAFGLPVMVFAHGFLNAILAVPCFYFAIRLEENDVSKSTNAEPDVIFFDGFCVLCSGTVGLLIKLDKNEALRYSSLQGDYARKILSPRQTELGASVIFRSGEVSFEKGEAVLHILMKLGGIFKVFGLILNGLPHFILDGLYVLIARNRYRLFGRNEFCLAPSNEKKKLFLP